MNSPIRTFLEKSKFWLNSRYVAIGKWMALSGMLYLALRFIDLGDVVASFAQISPLTLAGFLTLTLLSKFFYAFRWYLICMNGLGLHKVPYLFLLRINLFAEFVGIVLPSALGGEAVRVLKLNARTRTVAWSAASIAVDRLLGVVSMGLIVLVLLPKLGPSVLGRLPLTPSNLLIGTAFGVAGFGAIVFWLRRRSGWIRVSRAIQQIGLGVWLLMALVLLSVGGHLVFASGYYLLFQVIQPFPFLTVAALILTAQLARSVPISLLGIGLSEGSIVALARLVGMKTEAVLAVVVIALGGRYVFAICGLLIELLCDGRVFLNTVNRRTKAGLEILQ
jgi:uncharacterized membrane protein YbhN (UPF0104 family)